jgi:hypothetical protein
MNDKPWASKTYPKYERMVQDFKKIYQINRLKKKIIIRSIDTEKAFDKNPIPSWLKKNFLGM